MEETKKPEPTLKEEVAALKAEVKAEIAATRRSVVAELLAAFRSQSLWMKVAIIAAIVGGGAIIRSQREKEQPPAPTYIVLPAEQTPGLMKKSAAVSEAETARVEGSRLFGKVMRNRLRERLQKDGFALIGGNPTPLDSVTANLLVQKLDDDVIAAAAVQTGVVAEGRLIDSLRGVIDWLLNHREEIARLIKVLLTLLALFADDPAAVVN